MEESTKLNVLDTLPYKEKKNNRITFKNRPINNLLFFSAQCMSVKKE